MERILVKIGSNVLSRADGTLDVTRMSALVDQIVALRRAGYEVLVVTSGAVACGRSIVKVTEGLDTAEQRQLFSAVGQVQLINHYSNFFGEYGITIGQVLTMKQNFAPGEEYDNQKACMEVMLSNGVIPVINENDTVCITELMFTDNDELSVLTASMMQVSTMVILSNIDGFFDGNPESPESKVISRVSPEDDIADYVSGTKSSLGRGGMASKLAMARKAASEGIRVILANGKRDGILEDVIFRPESVVHTEFLPSEK